MKYIISDGDKVVNVLRNSYFPTAKLIGSLGRGCNSDNDIDILLIDYEPTELVKQNLLEVLGNIGQIEITDWGGFYFYETTFGTIDVFFNDNDFDF